MFSSRDLFGERWTRLLERTPCERCTALFVFRPVASYLRRCLGSSQARGVAGRARESTGCARQRPEGGRTDVLAGLRRTSRHRQPGRAFVVRLDRVLAVDPDPPRGASAAPPNYCPIRKTVQCMTQRIVTPCARRASSRTAAGHAIFRATRPAARLRAGRTDRGLRRCRYSRRSSMRFRFVSWFSFVLSYALGHGNLGIEYLLLDIRI